jgi:7-cyano-7-deazaguanine synthase
MSKAVVVLSGGQDSTTCLYWAKKHFDKLYAITFDYNQRHRVEIDAAKKIAATAGVVHHQVTELGPVLLGASPLISSSKLEQYADAASLPGGLEKTFVPGRNLLFLTLAANYAYSVGCTDVVTGVCQEDFGGYPDCRQVFIDSCQDAIRRGLSYNDQDIFANFCIHTPLMDLSKADSVRLAKSLPGCFEALAHSHTSYDGIYPPIGKDHASLLRAKGFEEAGYPDPLVLRAVFEGLMPLPETSNYDEYRSMNQLEFDFGGKA